MYLTTVTKQGVLQSLRYVKLKSLWIRRKRWDLYHSHHWKILKSVKQRAGFGTQRVNTVCLQFKLYQLQLLRPGEEGQTSSFKLEMQHSFTVAEEHVNTVVRAG